MRGWVELDSRDSLKPLSTDYDNTERNLSLNTYGQALTEPISTLVAK